MKENNSKFTVRCHPVMRRLHRRRGPPGDRGWRRGLDLNPRLDQVQRVHYADLHAAWRVAESRVITALGVSRNTLHTPTLELVHWNPLPVREEPRASPTNKFKTSYRVVV